MKSCRALEIAQRYVEGITGANLFTQNNDENIYQDFKSSMGGIGA
jgi:hypothetical protein